RMSQPVPSVAAHPEPEVLLDAVGASESLLPVETYDNGLQHTYIRLGSRDEVASLQPDLPRLASLGVMLSCFAGDGTEWKTRMFAPADGVPEDPATGSAAGPLVCHLCRHGVVDWGAEVEISQGVELGRPSTMYARAHGSEGEIERVEVGGSAVVVARGEFRL